MPSLTYTPGSRPPITYSAAGAAKYIHTPAAIKTSGIAAVQRGGGAAPRRRFPRDPRASAAASATSHATSAPSEYAPSAASANARVVVMMTLMMTAQKRRSSAGNAARFERSAMGNRKTTAPGRYAMAISDAIALSIISSQPVGKRPRSPLPPAPSCDAGTRDRAPGDP